MTIWILDDREVQINVAAPVEAVTVTVPDGEQFVLRDGDLLMRGVVMSDLHSGFRHHQWADLNWPSADVVVGWDSERGHVVYSKLSTGEELKRWDVKAEREVPVSTEDVHNGMDRP